MMRNKNLPVLAYWFGAWHVLFHEKMDAVHIEKAVNWCNRKNRESFKSTLDLRYNKDRHGF